MPLTPSAKRIAAQAEESAWQQAKALWRERLQRIQAAVSPPLRNSELSLALELDAGDGRASEVGRWVSSSPRLRHALPDVGMQARLSAVLDGSLHLAVRPGGHRREVLLCTDADLARLGRGWTLVNLAGRPLPDQGGDWEEEGWDLFSEPAPPPSTSPAPTPQQPVPSEDRLPVLGPAAACAPLPLPSLVLGCMRLSTQGRPVRAEALARIQQAADGGVRCFDSADSYCLDEGELHHNHALLAEALRGHPDALVLTKVGLARPGGRWVPDGSPERLLTQARRAREVLGVDALALLQLHVVDRRVPFDESLGALAELLAEGTAARIGLCNVDSAQLDQACARLPIAALQVEYSPRSLRSAPVIQRATAQGIPVLAHSPLGGHKRIGKAWPAPWQAAARELGVSPQRAALSWSLGLGHSPIVGATRAQSLKDSLAAEPVTSLAPLCPDQPRAGQVRIVMGPPASGKTQLVRPLEQAGWGRFNRDERGGSLKALAQALEQALSKGLRFAVLDNTYADRASRAQVIQAAQRHGLPVHLEWLDCPQREARINACQRMLERHGRILSPPELRELSRQDPNMLPPIAIDGWFSRLEPPTLDEGLATLRRQPFTRRPWGARAGVIFDYDGTLRRSTGKAPFPRHPDQVALLPGRKEVLDDLAAQGLVLMGASNQGIIEQGQLSHAQVQACFERTHALLGRTLPHRYSAWVDRQAWDRKPNPGMGVALLREQGVDRARCLIVGDMESDRLFAEALGVAFAWADNFFTNPQSCLESAGVLAIK
ncbi:MAG: aldo/keto reductase [Myxococcota bacterium]|nr:aldo/keto reductase [Myxococcota bacterium]